MNLKELTKKASYKKIQYPKKKESYMTLNDFIKILLGNQFSQFDFLENANVDEFDMFYTSPCLFGLDLLKFKHQT